MAGYNGLERPTITIYQKGGPCTGPVFGVYTLQACHAGLRREEILNIINHSSISSGPEYTGVNGKSRAWFERNLPKV